MQPTTVNSTTINNSGTATTTTLNTNAIQPKSIPNNVNIYTTSTGDINIGGSGKIYLNKSGYNCIETGVDTSISPSPYIDFHSSSFNTNYDATIYCNGGTATDAEGI